MSITAPRVESAPRAAAPVPAKPPHNEQFADGVVGGVVGGALGTLAGIGTAGRIGSRASGIGMAAIGLVPGAVGGAFGDAGVAGSTIVGAVLVGGAMAADKGLKFGGRVGMGALGAFAGALALGIPAALGAYAATRVNDGAFS